MLHARMGVAMLAAMALGMGSFGSAQAGDVFKGSVRGTATFVDASGPGSGFQTVDSVGTLTHMGKSRVALDMMPNQSSDGTPAHGFSGGATLVAANGDQVFMQIATEDPVVQISNDKTVATATFAGTYQMVGGTGRFSDAEMAGRLTITIRCDFRRRYWEIIIAW